MACSIRVSFTVDFSIEISWNRLDMRKRAYPTRDCANLPGPTYLYSTGMPESMLPDLPSPIFKNGKTGTPTRSLHDSHT